MLRVLRWILRGLQVLAVAVIVYVGYASFAYRDIPAATLDARYGGTELRSADVENAVIRYRLEGSRDPQAPMLVLIHSHFLDMGMWDAWVPLFAPHYRVLRYDLTGHGLTGPDPRGNYQVTRDVALLAGLLKKLQVDRVSLVGSSLGGNIAFTYAAIHPQQVQALVLINSGGLKRKDKPGRGSGRGIPAWADQVLPLVPPLALHRFLDWMVVDDRVITDEFRKRFVDLWRREGNRQAEIERLRQFETGDPDSLLASIVAPTLILWGEQNPQLPVALASEFEQKLTAARSVRRKIYPGAGHLLPVERPTESAADTLDFLQSLDRP
ncbi:MAG TPA: alpha/beta hydrolase [Fontimonas sp.]